MRLHDFESVVVLICNESDALSICEIARYVCSTSFEISHKGIDVILDKALYTYIVYTHL